MQKPDAVLKVSDKSNVETRQFGVLSRLQAVELKELSLSFECLAQNFDCYCDFVQVDHGSGAIFPVSAKEYKFRRMLTNV